MRDLAAGNTRLKREPSKTSRSRTDYRSSVPHLNRQIDVIG
ncbi:hypothetical protein J2S53_004479 [Actinopolyspora lacussalsi]|nr:hypothetical protein [Actinopolyspora lacussalsi]